MVLEAFAVVTPKKKDKTHKRDKSDTLEKSDRYDPYYHVENEYVCDNIFKASEQPYIDTAQAGKWGKGKDDSPVNKDELPPHNNPLPR